MNGLAVPMVQLALVRGQESKPFQVVSDHAQQLPAGSNWARRPSLNLVLLSAAERLQSVGFAVQSVAVDPLGQIPKPGHVEQRRQPGPVARFQWDAVCP